MFKFFELCEPIGVTDFYLPNSQENEIKNNETKNYLPHHYSRYWGVGYLF